MYFDLIAVPVLWLLLAAAGLNPIGVVLLTLVGLFVVILIKSFLTLADCLYESAEEVLCWL